MIDALKLVAAIIALTFMALSWAADRRPDVAWLQKFRVPELYPGQRERRRKQANRLAGMEMILVGLCLPIGYVMLSVMTFSSLDPWWIAGVTLVSMGCIVAGISALVKNWR